MNVNGFKWYISEGKIQKWRLRNTGVLPLFPQRSWGQSSYMGRWCSIIGSKSHLQQDIFNEDESPLKPANILQTIDVVFSDMFLRFYHFFSCEERVDVPAEATGSAQASEDGGTSKTFQGRCSIESFTASESIGIHISFFQMKNCSQNPKNHSDFLKQKSQGIITHLSNTSL